MKRLATLASFCAAVGLACTASAQTADTPAAAATVSADQAAIDALDKEIAEDWDASQRGQFIYLGYYMAAAALCDGLELEPTRLGKVVHESFLADEDKLPEADRKKLQERLIGHLAMSTGVFMGLHSHERADFCKRVSQERESSKDISSLFKD